MNLDDFENLAKTRRTCRHFQDRPLPEGMLERLLDCARWAPSGYNLQPVHFITVTEEKRKEKLFKACMNQRQILEAPVTVIFLGESRPMESNFEDTLKCDAEAAALTPEHEAVLRKFVPLAFSGGPLGLGRLAKKFGAPVMRLVQPIPKIPVVDPGFWATKQVMLSAMNFMLAAHAAGLATVPMEGFDEARVKKVVKIPRGHVLPLVIPLGYAVPGDLKKGRLPLGRMWHHETWSEAGKGK